jgi:phosphoribosylformimino-5-aminoimidazole carboxamide ribotide isomerase
MSVSESIASMDASAFAQELMKIGINQIILLDLDRVGTEQGINWSLLRTILENTKFKVLVGGGIRSIQELEKLKKLGISGALIATILHNGKLKVDELKAANLL